jgi:hypothetical protein
MARIEQGDTVKKENKMNDEKTRKNKKHEPRERSPNTSDYASITVFEPRQSKRNKS